MATKKVSKANAAKLVDPAKIGQHYFDHQAFVAAYEARFGKLTPSQYFGLDALIGLMEVDPTIDRLSWYAYMLATTKHECANTWTPITEFGPKEYFDKYEPGTTIGDKLGNTKPGDGYLYRGRGFVQITGRANYQRLSNKLGLGDALVKTPDLALETANAYRLLSVGMVGGLFTGKKLADYLTATTTDYVNARRVVNGQDQAALIKGYATGIEACLAAARIGVALFLVQKVPVWNQALA